MNNIAKAIDDFKVAVVTPYFEEDISTILSCHESVVSQTFKCRHILVADGAANTAIRDWNVDHIVLERNYADIGSTPRWMGCRHAIHLGVDVIAFLDADNWYEPDHIESLLDLGQQTGASFLTSGRMLRRLDDTVMGPCPITDPANFIDTSCMMFLEEAFPQLSLWRDLPSYGHLIGDRIMLQAVHRAGLATAFSSRHTVNYRCKRAGLYWQLQQEIPAEVTERPDYETAFARWEADGNPPLHGSRNRQLEEQGKG